MIYYLNFGFVLEQALVDVVKTYIDRLGLDAVYGNYHISVTNEHPFAHMVIDQNARCSDTFPTVVITTQSDNKVSELANVPVQTSGIGLTSEDLDNLVGSTLRNKTKINANGESVVVVKNGVIQKEKIPGYILVTDETKIAKLKEVAESRTVGDVAGMVYGIKYNTRRHDNVSVEIWAENNQLKNEIYEHLRILFSSSLNEVLKEKYAMFDIEIFDNSVNGERSNNLNYDFDELLWGAHISFGVDYNVSQIIVDTAIEDINYDLITEVINHVKE